MTPRFILITTAAILLAGCDRNSAVTDAAKTAELEQQRQKMQADNDKIRALEERLNAADQQKAADKEAEFARVKEELAQVKQEKERAAERIRELQDTANRPPPVAEAPARVDAEPKRSAGQRRSTAEARGTAVHADLERVVEEEEDREPVYVGREVPETQRVSSVQSFYEPLDPYGDWIETDDYGYVFRPTAATRTNWRPYTDGHWVHTGHGWTWQSNEDFGWATYHYGRWTRISGSGWVWVPGREWGPGWVSWRRGNEHAGWAPLPPESRGRFSFTATVDRDYDIGPAAYVFVALSNFGARSYAPVIERPERNVTIINKTVNITNITYDNSVNKTVVYNGGPSYDLIRARSQQPVENVNVNFAPQNTTINKATKIVNIRQGDTLQVAAPPMAAAAIAAPLRVKEKIGKPKVDKGWDGVDPAKAQQVKQDIAATSTERKKKPKTGAEAAMPPIPKPGVPPVNVPSVVPLKPEPPKVAAPNPANPPLPDVKPEIPGRVERQRRLDPEAAKPKPAPEVLPKADKPDMPAEVKKPKVSDPDPAKPKPAPEVLPKADKPDMPAEVRKPKVLDPDPAKPKPAPEVLPKADKPDMPAEVRKPKVLDPDPIKPKHAPATPAPPEPKRERPVMPKFNEPVDAPVKKVPVEQPLRVKQPKPDRPAIEPAPEAARVPKTERREKVAAPENPPAARVKKQFVPDAQPQPQRIAKPQEAPVRRAPQEFRQPEPKVNRQAVIDAGERQREKQMRQQSPAVQRPPQPQAPPQPGQPQPNGGDSEKKKKKKDKEEGQ